MFYLLNNPKYMGIAFIVLIIIPLIEIGVTDVNRTELDCTSSMNISVIDWSVSKNIFIMM